ncbi:GntR family transcriptional regulator [Pleomorphovibrio marinus]|uniref:GntR family transcriptional regulator n=1 Tax=Pleomorphovibrio marinus TaxID=2164132 RepID=UPI000E09FABA|nr:GntR family transcriptional regulator [Pleomorphovibrio marinus]
MVTDVCSRLRIDSESRIPKYQQIVNAVIHDIEKGYLKVGEKIPSISEISEEYLLSRDTVEKALNILKKKKIILSVKGKGYYVAKSLEQSKPRVLFLLNKLSDYKMKIYNHFVESLGEESRVELQLFYCDPEILGNILQENVDAYDYFVVMPHFKELSPEKAHNRDKALYYIQQIPEDRLVIMDNYLPELGDQIAGIYQDFKQDIHDALREGLEKLQKYDKLILVYPENNFYPYPKEIKEGFNKFCQEQDFNHEIIPTIYPNMEFSSNDAYIFVDEEDLVDLMKQVKENKIELGKDLGVISYNDTPLKRLLDITVISTDFRAMGETASFMIKKGKRELVKNVFHFIDRGSV